MSYADKMVVVNHFIKTADMAAAPSDNDDLFHIMVPAGREVEIQAVLGYVAAASDGADFVELVKEDNTVLCKIALQTTGKKAAVNSDGSTATTFPVRVAPQSDTATSLLKLRCDGTLDATTTANIQVHISGLV